MAGISRSATLVIAYLMKYMNMTMQQAFSTISSKRRKVSLFLFRSTRIQDLWNNSRNTRVFWEETDFRVFRGKTIPWLQLLATIWKDSRAQTNMGSPHLIAGTEKRTNTPDIIQSRRETFSQKNTIQNTNQLWVSASTTTTWKSTTKVQREDLLRAGTTDQCNLSQMRQTTKLQEWLISQWMWRTWVETWTIG